VRQLVVGVVAVVVLTGCTAGPPGRSAWKKELTQQITASGVVPKAEAECIAQRFIDSMSDAAFADFNQRGHLNDAEKADVASLTLECAHDASA
jgi:hypothetical protein